MHEFCWQVCGAGPILSGFGELLGLLVAYSKVAVQPRFVDVELLEMAGWVVGPWGSRIWGRYGFADSLNVDRQWFDPDVIGMTGASIALTLSDIPFNGPIAAVRVGRVDGKIVINPTAAHVSA